ncbi:helix-turn-helix transcriptional regulator [Actinomadura sp. WMMA1423]|uniref:helix-turn-helix transcriptional regulator n=1 Tax=Actinomadura sp. WMMA1423 TaxID=2591108 RepID=UPI00197A94E5|nr:AraC family transcriptional regulator [Actinomadura sp. WMMA1423]
MGNAQGTQGAPPTLDTGVLRRMRIARDAMDREWAEPLDVSAVAARAGYSRYHFVRLFHEVYGEPPGAYLARRRIERAQHLLRTADLTVTEICMQVGFTSLGTFCTRFKQQTGTTPTEFRRRARTGDAAAIPGCFVLLWAGGFRERPAPGGGETPAGGEMTSGGEMSAASKNREGRAARGALA